MTMKNIYTLLFILTCLLITGSCKDEETTVCKVVVIHSQDEAGAEGQLFQDYMEKRFEQEGIHADIRHLYLNLAKEPMLSNENNHQSEYAEFLSEWNPEVILVNQDLALTWLLRTGKPELRNDANYVLNRIFTRVPVVVAGVNLLNRQELAAYPNITGFEDRMDIAQNLKLAREITGGSSVHIELDYTDYDQKLRTFIRQQIKDNKHILNNASFRISTQDPEKLRKTYPETTVLTFLSASDPEKNRNGKESTDSLRGVREMEQFLKNCKDPIYAQLQVKFDAFSNTFIHHSGIPQLTAIRTQYDNRNRYILGGYFSSMETQIDDQVNYAAQILRGAKAQNLPFAIHQKGFYMDYKAMTQFKPAPLRYKDWKDKFEIMNAPLEERNPLLFWSIITGIGLAFAGIFILISRYLYFLPLQKEMNQWNTLRKKHQMRNMVMDNADTYLWYLSNNSLKLSSSVRKKYNLPNRLPLDTLHKFVLSDSQPALNRFLDYASHPGKNKVRFHLSWTGKPEDTHWYELIYTVSRENILEKRIMGIGTRIDDIIETENKLTDIQGEIDEMQQKQYFLNSISHDLRTPLNAVTGFAQLMATDDIHLSAEELKEYNQAIVENSEQMKKMIASVIDHKENYDDNIVLNPLKFSVSFFLKQVYQTHQILIPSRLEFLLEQEDTDRFLFVDLEKTRLVLNNFLGNAIKFTPTGQITIGWKYLPESEEIMIYCRDTGIGMKETDRARVFDPFFKVQENAKGTGLGLSISQTIIRKQNGIIGVDSAPDKGSTFWFKFKEYKES